MTVTSQLSIETVQDVMMNWSIRYKEKAYSPEELTILAAEYYEDLIEEEITPALFEQLVKVVRKRAEFFPTMKLVLSCKEQALNEINKAAEKKRAGILRLDAPKEDDYRRASFNNLRNIVLEKISEGIGWEPAAQLFEYINAEQKKGKDHKEVGKGLMELINKRKEKK